MTLDVAPHPLPAHSALLLLKLGCWAMALAALPAMSEDGGSASQRGLELTQVQTPDGRQWALRRDGTGRPFELRVVLVNRSKSQVRVWSPDNSEGSQAVTIVLGDSEGKRTHLRPQAVERSGMPTAVTLMPNQALAIRIDLLRIVPLPAPTPGRYLLRAWYANEVATAGNVEGVWTGKIVSTPFEIEITSPGCDD